MAGILASGGCFCRNVDIMISKHRLKENSRFSGTVSGRNSEPRRRAYSLPVARNDLRVRVKMQKDAGEVNGQSVGTRPPNGANVSGQDRNLQLSSRLSTTQSDTPTRYGGVVNMVPASERVKSKSVSVDKSKKVNELKPLFNGSLVKRDASVHSVETTKFGVSYGHPSVEELKILPSDEGFSWATENYSSWQRTMDIWFSVISLYTRIRLDSAKWTYLGGCTENKQKKRRRKTAAWLRERILQLGPTFIKLGQLSSTRSDLFPQEFVDELAKLQDRVPAFSPEKARNLIKTELGEPVDILFKDFEDQPIAAASLGQVHRAILHNGEKVVVKVQRPGLNKLFDIDLGNLKLVAEYFQKSETFGGPTRDWIGIYKECSKILYQEIDYINEAKNADRFRHDFRNIKWVRIPLLYWNYTARRVLALEYVPGIKIDNLDALDSRGYNRSRISTLASEAYLIQILKTGFFHADPHPGNLAIDADEALIYYDYGMMGEIESFTQERLHELFYAVYEKDAKEVVKSLIELGVLQPTGDMSSVRRTVQYFLDNSLSQTLDRKQTFAAIGEDLFAIAQDQPFRFPATFTFVLRAFTTLEGIGRAIHPDYSFLKIATPYAQGLLDSRQKQQSGIQIVQGMRKQADDARTHALSMPCRIQRIEEIMKQLESGDLKLRVRVLESERAAKKAAILQIATIQTILGGTLLNIAVTLSTQGSQAIATGSFLGAGFFLALFVSSIQRVKNLDKLELSL